jgi:hypothetical protein
MLKVGDETTDSKTTHNTRQVSKRRSHVNCRFNWPSRKRDDAAATLPIHHSQHDFLALISYFDGNSPMSCTSSRLELLQAVIEFAGALRIASKARDSKPNLEQALTDLTQAHRMVKDLLSTGSLSGRQRASLEKWVDRSEQELRVLLAAPHGLK